MMLFYPTIMKDRITDISLSELQAHGIKGLLLDIDNTLTTHGSQELTPAVRDWLDAMRRAGMRMTVVSNAKSARVLPFGRTIGLEVLSTALKPLPFGFWRAVRRLGLKRRECVVIGDQIFTDILGARLSGIRSIQLMPIELEREKPFLMFKRGLEKRIVARYKRRCTQR